MQFRRRPFVTRFRQYFWVLYSLAMPCLVDLGLYGLAEIFAASRTTTPFFSHDIPISIYRNVLVIRHNVLCLPCFESERYNHGSTRVCVACWCVGFTGTRAGSEYSSIF